MNEFNFNYENYMKYWVYIHLFPNGKRYVGLTTSFNPVLRWQSGKGYRTQKLTYRAILKYGWKNIQHILYQVDTEKEMKYLERYLIAYYNTTNPLYGYNISTGGDGNPGVPSAARKSIDQFDKQGNYIKTWESILSIDQELDYDWRNISACVRKKRPTAYGFYWSYTGELPEFKKMRTKRQVLQYDLNGTFIAEYKSAAEAGKSINKGNSSIVHCCNHKLKSAYNFIWRWK